MVQSAFRRCALLVCAGLAAAALAAVPATAAPVAIDFESGAAVGETVTSQYGAPATPAGPLFQRGTDAGFAGLGAGPPKIASGSGATSGTRALTNGNCGSGEFWTSAMFFAVGYATTSVSFQVATTSAGMVEVTTTAFRADRSVIYHQSTILAPGTGFKGVPMLSGAGDIAFVSVEVGSRTPSPNPNSASGVNQLLGNTCLVVDDLTYDPPASPPNSSFLLGASPASTQLPPGGQAVVQIPITWTNNPNPASSPVSLEAVAPEGMTATFSPNPTATGSSQLTLQTTKQVASGPRTITVTGYVDKGLPSQKSAQVAIPVVITEPFVLNALSVPRMSPCTTSDVTVRVALDPQLTDKVRLILDWKDTGAPPMVATSEDDGTLYDDGKSAIAYVKPSGGIAQMKVTIIPPPGAKPGTYTLLADALVPGFAPRSVTTTAVVDAGEVTGAVFANTSTPLGIALPGGFLQPPSTIGLRGRGFCPGSRVSFGSDGASAPASSVAADGRALTVTLPRSALDGRVKVIPPQGDVIDSDTTLGVPSFRGRWGLSTVNAGAPNDFYFSQFEEVFGYDAMHLKIDLCAGLSFGLASCPLVTPIPDPYAWSIWLALKGRGKIGLCYGFSLTAGEFAAGVPFASFPPGNARFPNGLESPFNGGPLLQRVETNHIRQFDANVIEAWAGAIVANWGATPAQRAQKLRTLLETELEKKPAAPAFGQPPVVSMREGTSGHAVLAYDVEDLGGGRFRIDVYDPNNPVDAAARADGSVHAARHAISSIEVDPASDRWTFAGLTKTEGGKQVPWGGDLGGKGLVVLPSSATYFRKARLPGLGQIPALVVLASGGAQLDQVTDGAGRRLLGGDGEPLAGAGGIRDARVLPPTDAADGGNPMALLPRDGEYRLQARPGRGGVLTAAGRGFVAQGAVTTGGGASASATGNGPAMTVAGRRPAATLEPGGAGAASLKLVARGGGGTRTAVLEGRGSAGQADTLRVSPDGSLELSHRGSAASRSLTLSFVGGRALPVTARLERLAVAPGERVRIRVRDWRRLDAAVVQRSSGRRTVVRLRRAGARLVGRARMRARGRTVTISLARAGRAVAQSGGATVVVTRGRRIVARRRLSIDGADLRRRATTLRTTVPRLAKGRYVVRAAVTLTARGAGGLPASDLRVVRAQLIVK